MHNFLPDTDRFLKFPMQRLSFVPHRQWLFLFPCRLRLFSVSHQKLAILLRRPKKQFVLSLRQPLFLFISRQKRFFFIFPGNTSFLIPPQLAAVCVFLSRQSPFFSSCQITSGFLVQTMAVCSIVP